MASPSVTVDIVADDTPFTRSMGRVVSKAASFGKILSRMGGGATVALGAIAVSAASVGAAMAGAGIAVAKFAASQRDAIDNLAKTSDRLGIATEKLAGFRLAAELAGVGTATADKGLEQFVRRTAEAAQGTGEAVDAIAALGLSASELSRMTPDAALRLVADRMGDVENQAQRVQIAYDLFGREGVKLVNTLMGGAEAMDDAERKARALGLAISRTDAAKVEAANDAYTLFGRAIEGVASRFTVALAPAAEETFNRIVDAIIDNEATFQQFADTAGAVFDLLGRLTRGFIGLIDGIGPHVIGIGESVEIMADNFEKYATLAMLYFNREVELAVTNTLTLFKNLFTGGIPSAMQALVDVAREVFGAVQDIGEISMKGLAKATIRAFDAVRRGDLLGVREAFADTVSESFVKFADVARKTQSNIRGIGAELSTDLLKGITDKSSFDKAIQVLEGALAKSIERQLKDTGESESPAIQPPQPATVIEGEMVRGIAENLFSSGNAAFNALTKTLGTMNAGRSDSGPAQKRRQQVQFTAPDQLFRQIQAELSGGSDQQQIARNTNNTAEQTRKAADAAEKTVSVLEVLKNISGDANLFLRQISDRLPQPALGR